MLPLMYVHPNPRLAAEKVGANGQRGGWWSPGSPWLGEIEALESLASYSFERPDDPFPEFLEGPRCLRRQRGLGHPLIAPRNACSANDVDLSGPGQSCSW